MTTLPEPRDIALLHLSTAFGPTFPRIAKTKILITSWNTLAAQVGTLKEDVFVFKL